MRLGPITLACTLVAMVAPAHGDGAGARPAAPVIGGTDAVAGKWPDVAAVLFPTNGDDLQGCTGTLIAPTVVLTAGHCAEPDDLPDNVLIGAHSLARPGDGETIAIARAEAFPDPVITQDVAVLVLAEPSTREPRRLATGWARFDIVNGAQVALVGFGAINREGDEFVNELQEGRSTITDADCSRSSGCNAAAQPAGELGAGGMGIDTCPGDSGGPLYLLTSHGAYLAGVTSRGYDNATFTCSEGGIYGRPDKLVAWIEAVAGVPVAHGPEPAAAPIVAIRGDGGDTRIAVNDPASNAHSFAIMAPPAHGTAKVRSDGAVRVCTDADAPAEDELTVMITDTRHGGRALPVTIRVQIEDGPATAACDLDAFGLDDEGGGCCDSRGRSAGAALPLALAVLAVVMRRRTKTRGPG